eukprot:CAMPEP_0175166986 /NCGR_PEP_ID=MMETSP0087-20121206/28046_1 /TAXON_ID=136419 /ORGANISM="Unknown Unknown, Strain D1" /LENGTH=194 /DNA_ID=CAMNT_0016456735 /DNA_START=147 /DNA_END=727 /DNA_ORIENTATION=+
MDEPFTLACFSSSPSGHSTRIARGPANPVANVGAAEDAAVFTASEITSEGKLFILPRLSRSLFIQPIIRPLGSLDRDPECLGQTSRGLTISTAKKTGPELSVVREVLVVGRAGIWFLGSEVFWVRITWLCRWPLWCWCRAALNRMPWFLKPDVASAAARAAAMANLASVSASTASWSFDTAIASACCCLNLSCA